jgi:hypothetical protein
LVGAFPRPGVGVGLVSEEWNTTGPKMQRTRPTILTISEEEWNIFKTEDTMNNTYEEFGLLLKQHGKNWQTMS